MNHHNWRFPAAIWEDGPSLSFLFLLSLRHRHCHSLFWHTGVSFFYSMRLGEKSLLKKKKKKRKGERRGRVGSKTALDEENAYIALLSTPLQACWKRIEFFDLRKCNSGSVHELQLSWVLRWCWSSRDRERTMVACGFVTVCCGSGGLLACVMRGRR